MFYRLLTFSHDEEAGRLFRSVLGYAKSGVAPDFGDSVALNMAWRFVRLQIERDMAVYDKKLLKTRYAVYCREQKKKDIEPLAFEEWVQVMSSDDTKNQTLSSDSERYPIPIPTLTPTLTPTPIPTPTLIPAPTPTPSPINEGSRESPDDSDTTLFDPLDDGPDFETLRTRSVKLLEGYQ